MRVLLVGDYPPPIGGVAIHVQQLHAYLERHGVPVHGLDVGKGARARNRVTPIRSAPELALALATEGSAITHLHTSGNNPKAWGLVAAVGLLRAARAGPRFVTLHSGLLQAWLAEGRSHRGAVRAALAPYAGIVAVSDAVAAALHSAGVRSGRIHVHPAFLRSQVIAGQPPTSFEAVRARRRILLAYAHHPSPVYGREVLFRALPALAARHPGLGVVLFGPGSRSDELQRSAAEAGVEALIEPLGELEHPQALAVLQRSDVFLRPTMADGDAISVREALALGVPCVASDAAVRPEGVHLHAVGDAADLARAVVEALAAARLTARGPDAGHFLMQRYAEAWGAPLPASRPERG